MQTGIKRGFLLSAIAAGVGLGWAGTFSSAVLVDATNRDRHWQTVCTNEISLRLDWPSESTRASLAIEGMNASFGTNVTSAVSNVLWRAFASGVPSSEDVYDLTLTFYTNGTMVADVQSGRVAVVKGAFGSVSVDAVAGSRSWWKIASSAVIPYDALWAENGTNVSASQIVIAKSGGGIQTNAFADASGYWGWKLRNSGWGYGTFGLTLTFANVTNAWTADVFRPLDGTTVSVR